LHSADKIGIGYLLARGYS